MKQGFAKFIPVVLALSAVALPAHAQNNGNFCASSQTMAVKCYVRNALETSTVYLPSGMTMQQYQAYGVAILRILQSGHTYFMVLSASAAISDAMPATNGDGSANQAAQDAAVNSIVDAALTNGLITLPSNVTEGQGAAVCTRHHRQDGYQRWSIVLARRRPSHDRLLPRHLH